jgi:hypothetical protein
MRITRVFSLYGLLLKIFFSTVFICFISLELLRLFGIYALSAVTSNSKISVRGNLVTAESDKPRKTLNAAY